MIRIITIGKIKEDYLKKAIDEYQKRLSRFTKLEIIELKDEVIPDNPSDAIIDKVKTTEGNSILSKIKDDYVIVLDLRGEMIDSVKFSHKIEDLNSKGISKITFVIGGSLGLSDDVIKKADYKLSFSKMTFPHQLFRVILLEQIYRAYKIMNNETYHK